MLATQAFFIRVSRKSISELFQVVCETLMMLMIWSQNYTRVGTVANWLICTTYVCLWALKITFLCFVNGFEKLYSNDLLHFFVGCYSTFYAIFHILYICRHEWLLNQLICPKLETHCIDPNETNVKALTGSNNWKVINSS